MRKKTQIQIPLLISSIEHSHAAELEGISKILDANPIINESRSILKMKPAAQTKDR